MDVSWDLLAYHHYYSWLFVNGDMGQADPEPYVNRYQNPLAELPWYLLDQVMSPRAATATIAAIAGLNLVLIRRVTMVLLPTHVTGLRRLALGLASVVLAAVGATFSMELGMSAADVIDSIPMLASLLLVLRFAMAPESSRGQRWLLVVAGVLAGCALGAKLTMMPYVVAMAACVVYLCVVARTGWPLVRFGLGGVTGVLASSGWWLYDIWRLTGSPVFPYFNSLFKSPYWSDTNVRDERFGPRGLGDALLYPWYMAKGTPRVLDVPMRDLRWTVLLIVAGLAVVVAVGHLAHRKLSRRPRRRESPHSAVVFWVFFVLAGLLWLFQFGIARYAVTTELLAGTALVMCLVTVFRRAWPAAIAGLVLSVWMAPYNVGHFYHVPFQKDRFMVQSAPLKAVPLDSIVLADNGSSPSGFLLPYLPSGVERHVIQGWFYDTPIMSRLHARLDRAPHVYVILGHPWPHREGARTNLRNEVGLEVDTSTCRLVRSTLPNRQICEASYRGPRQD